MSSLATPFHRVHASILSGLHRGRIDDRKRPRNNRQFSNGLVAFGVWLYAVACRLLQAGYGLYRILGNMFEAKLLKISKLLQTQRPSRTTEPAETSNADEDAALELPELVVKGIAQHLRLSETKAVRLSCKHLCQAFSSQPVNLRIPVPLNGSQQATASEQLLTTWVQPNCIVFDWSLWSGWSAPEQNSPELVQLMSALDHIQVSCLAQGIKEVEMEHFPDCSAALQCLVYLAPLRVRLNLFRPPSLWWPFKKVRERGVLNRFKAASLSCQASRLLDLRCLHLMEDLEQLEGYIFRQLEKYEIYKRPPHSVSHVTASLQDGLGDITALSSLTRLTSLTLHTLTHVYGDSSTGVGTDIMCRFLLRGIPPDFYAPKLAALSTLTNLTHLSFDLILDISDDDRQQAMDVGEGTSLFGKDDLSPARSSAAFLLCLPKLTSLTLRMHPQRGLNTLVSLLRSLTQLKKLSLILLVPTRAIGLRCYSTEHLSFLSRLSSLSNADITFHQRVHLGPMLVSPMQTIEQEVYMLGCGTWDELSPAIPVWNLFQSAPLTRLVLCEVYFSNTYMSCLKNLTGLQQLTIMGVRCEREDPWVGADVLVELSHLRCLTDLHVAIMAEPLAHNLWAPYTESDVPHMHHVFNNRVAQAFAHGLKELKYLRLAHVDDSQLSSTGLFALVNGCANLSHLVINGKDLGMLVRRCVHVRPPLDDAAFCTLVEGLLDPRLVELSRIIKQIYERDKRQRMYGMLLAFLVSRPLLHESLLAASTADAVRRLLEADKHVQGSDQYLRQLLVV